MEQILWLGIACNVHWLVVFDGISTFVGYLLGITLFPRNELIHLPYIAVATQTRVEGEEQLLIGIVLERWRLEIALDHLTCYRNNRSQYYRWTIFLFCIYLSYVLVN